MTSARASMPQDPILVIGAGQAGAGCVAALRAGGYEGGVVWVGAERHPAYERPPLSKAVLADEAAEASLSIGGGAQPPDPMLDLRLSTRVERLHPGSHEADCSDGRTVRFSRCLLATGGAARALPALPPGTPGVHYLRTLDDARALRAALGRLHASDGELVVLGGGFLGLEVASTARERGCRVTVIEAAPRLLQRALPPVLSDWLCARARQAGVDLHLGLTCTALTPVQEGDRTGVDLQLGQAGRRRADVLVVAVGQSPDVALAREAGLAVDPASGGVLIDAQGRTSAPDIYAAGDCTSQVQVPDGAALRLESWQGANEQARLAAAAMLDQVVPARAVPWFWTDQFGCNVQMLGLPAADLVFHERDQADVQAPSPRGLWLGMQGDRLRQVLGVNAGGDVRALRPLLEQDRHVDISVLCSAPSLKAAVREITQAGKARA